MPRARPRQATFDDLDSLESGHAREYVPAELLNPPLPGAVVAFSSMPTAIMKKVQQFEIDPLFRYGRSTFAIRAFSGRASIGRGTSLLRVPFGRSDDATRGMPDASSEEEFARGR